MQMVIWQESESGLSDFRKQGQNDWTFEALQPDLKRCNGFHYKFFGVLFGHIFYK